MHLKLELQSPIVKNKDNEPNFKFFIIFIRNDTQKGYLITES